MTHIYWTAESWGNAYPPVNYEEICAAANEIIEAQQDCTEEELENLSEKLWEEFCMTDSIGGVTAIYEEA